MIEKTFKGPIHYQLKNALDWIQNAFLEEKNQKVPNQAEAIRTWNYPIALWKSSSPTQSITVPARFRSRSQFGSRRQKSRSLPILASMQVSGKKITQNIRSVPENIEIEESETF